MKKIEKRISGLALVEAFKEATLAQLKIAAEGGSAEPEVLDVCRKNLEFMLDYPTLFFDDINRDCRD